MGRGRQKAKQTKVARQLKYFSPETDYDALQRELSTGNGGDVTASDTGDGDGDDEDFDDRDDDLDDEYADWPAHGGR